MRDLLILALGIGMSVAAYATMEASWNVDENHPAAAKKMSCPQFVYVRDDNGALTERIWTHEYKSRQMSMVDTPECIYR